MDAPGITSFPLVHLLGNVLTLRVNHFALALMLKNAAPRITNKFLLSSRCLASQGSAQITRLTLQPQLEQVEHPVDRLPRDV